MPVVTRPKRVVRQKAKGPIDPSVGLKIRELRTARAMTQAQLAGPDFSKGFISLLETGRTRISLRAAQVLAARLGVEVTDLLSAHSAERQDIEFMLLRAEQALRAGDTKVAAEIGASWAKKAGGVLRARFQRLHARALIETARSTDAVKLLDNALRAFRSFGATEYAARTLFDLARAHSRLYSFGEALRYALQAEQAIERGDLIDRTLELDIHRLLAGIYLALGDSPSAQIRAERARALAEDVADPAAVAKMYESLALVRFEQGDKEAALAYARKATGLFETLGYREKVAETWNTLGWLFTQRQQYGKAAEALDRADKLALELGLSRLSGWIQASRAELALARGSHREAADLAAGVSGQKDVSSRLRGFALLVRAQALAAGGTSIAQLRQAFGDALAASKDDPVREQAKVHQAYAAALAARKQLPDAYAEARKALELVGPKI